jgi:predicted dehydrogenase
MPETIPYRNCYRAGWEEFIAHVVEDAPFRATFLAAAEGVQLAEAAYRSNAERHWVDLPGLALAK